VIVNNKHLSVLGCRVKKPSPSQPGQSCYKGAHPFFVCARPGRLFTEVNFHTYFQLPVTYQQD